MKRYAKTLLGILATVGAASAAHAGNYGKTQDLVDTAVAAGKFQTLATALTEAGLVETLKGKGPFTVFAPTDAAFAKLPKGTVETLLKPENRDQLVAVLTYHVVSGNWNADAVGQMTAATTLNGQRIDIDATKDAVSIDNASVIQADMKASNGVIHVIDTVLLPETATVLGVAKNAGTFGTLLAAVQAAGLEDALQGDGPFTVFAPTDEAFAKLPAGTVESLLREENRGRLQQILKYHVVAGRMFSNDVLAGKPLETLAMRKLTASTTDGTPRINESAFVATDLDAANGVVHVIDTVLLPPEAHSAVSAGGTSHL